MAASPTPARPNLFRAEALEHRAGAPTEGDVLRLPPSWTRWTYWLVLAVVLAGAAVLVFGRVQRYASGPAVVRFEGAGRITAPTAGIVARVLVERGQAVEAGTALVLLDDGPLAAVEARLVEQFEAHLAARLFDPGDEEAGRALTTLRAERQRVESARERHVVRAHRTGVVDDVRTRAGRAVDEGQVLVTLDGPGARPVLVALLPGAVRPELADGLRLRVEAPGVRRGSAWLEGATASASIIGPTEARRVLGPDVADAVDFSGPVASVEVELPGDTLLLGDVLVRLHDGMHLRVETPLGRESLLAVLFPGLRGVLGDEPPAQSPDDRP